MERTYKIYYDNKSTTSIIRNPVQHDWTKHVEVDWHFIKEKFENGLICTIYIPREGQLTDILTKGLPTQSFQTILRKLGMRNIYSSAKGECEKICQLVLQIYEDSSSSYEL